MPRRGRVARREARRDRGRRVALEQALRALTDEPINRWQHRRVRSISSGSGFRGGDDETLAACKRRSPSASGYSKSARAPDRSTGSQSVTLARRAGTWLLEMYPWRTCRLERWSWSCASNSMLRVGCRVPVAGSASAMTARCIWRRAASRRRASRRTTCTSLPKMAACSSLRRPQSLNERLSDAVSPFRMRNAGAWSQPRARRDA